MSFELWLKESQLKKAEEVRDTLYDSANGSKLYPKREEVFRAFEFFSPQECKVCILGQDPYHNPGQAMGLSFSVPSGVVLPPSLRNIFKQISNEYGTPLRLDGNLEGWAKQGVLLLNTALSVEHGKPGSHAQCGWEGVVLDALENLLQVNKNVVFLLWGSFAKKIFVSLVEKRLSDCVDNYHWIETSHPSPLSAYRGFLGSNVFSRTNTLLLSRGLSPINWLS